MTGLAYLASIFAVLWLSYWVFQGSRSEPKQNSKRITKPQWAPFDYYSAQMTTAEPAEQDQIRGWRSRAVSERRRR